MALLISFDGTGIVAYADGEATDTGGGTWGELGGGTVGDNPDVYLYGNNSFGSQYASREGITYYQDDTTLDFNTTGEMLYMLINIQSNGAFLLYNSGGTLLGSFNTVIGSSTGDLYHWNIASKGSSNGWTGGWKGFAIDPTMITGAETVGTPNLTTANTYGVWIDTDVSVRAESVFQSMIISAKGATVTGSPTNPSEGWDELAFWCTDYINRAFPFIEVRGGTYFMKGSLSIGDGSLLTVFSADGNNIECEESSFYNGTSWISTMPTNVNKIITLANASIDWTTVSISGYIDNKLSIDTSIGNASTFRGGTINTTSTIICKSTDTFSGVVIGNYDIRTLGSELYENCTFDGSSTLTIDASSNFANVNIINGTPAVDSISTTDLVYLSTDKLNSSGSNHGVNLTSIGTGTMTWDNVTSAFDVGVTGSPITPTSTGNEDIYITATSSSDITINIASGATIPSIRVAASFTGNVNVVAGLVSFTFTLSPSITTYEYRIYSVTALGSLVGAIELQGLENSLQDNYTYTYTYSSDIFIAVQILSHDTKDYEESVTFYTLGPNDQDIGILLVPDNND